MSPPANIMTFGPGLTYLILYRRRKRGGARGRSPPPTVNFEVIHVNWLTKFQIPNCNTFWDMNYFLVQSRQTDRKRRIRTHRAICTGGLRKSIANKELLAEVAMIRGYLQCNSIPVCLFSLWTINGVPIESSKIICSVTLTCPKGVHQFRYFLPQCAHQILLLAAHTYMHFDCNYPLMRTSDVRIECLIAILRQNAYVHE